MAMRWHTKGMRTVYEKDTTVSHFVRFLRILGLFRSTAHFQTSAMLSDSKSAAAFFSVALRELYGSTAGAFAVA